MMKREGLVERGIRVALTLGVLLMVSAGGMRGAGHGSVTGENAGDAGHGLAAAENAGGDGESFASAESAEDAGRGTAAVEQTDMTGVSETTGAVVFRNGSGTAALSTGNPGAGTARATLTPDEPEVEMQGNVLTYGGLCVAFPEEIEPERIDAQDNGNIFDNGHFLSDGSKGRILDLCGAQDVYADRAGGDGIEVYLALPPRVRLMHYRAVYDSETALLCALFDLLPEAVGRRMYADEEKREYTYRLEQDGYLYLFLVRGEEVCLAQEIAEEEDCSFGELVKDGLAVWQADGGTVGCWQKPDAFSYRKIVPEQGMTLFYACERQDDSAILRLFREGYYETPWQEIHGYIKAERDLHVEDVNFDGCPDFAGYGEVYLWNRQTKAYEQAQADISAYSLYHRRFPETESFWEDSTYAAYQNNESVRAAEAIWHWEGSSLVKKRECVVCAAGDGMRLFAYEGTPERVLFDETFSMEEWEREEQGRVRTLYGQFYDGMAPEELYAEKHRLEGDGKYIPQKCLDEIASLMAAKEDPVILSEVGDGKESAVFGAAGGRDASRLHGTMSGRKLDEEEAVALARRDFAVRQQVQNAARGSYAYTIMEADCDNDGTADLFWQLDGFYIGGQSGTVEYIFMKGHPDGSYEETDFFFEQPEEFHVLSYEGKNYICYLDFDSDRLIYNGYTVRSYEDGKRVEKAGVHVVLDKYESPRVQAETGFERLAADMAGKCDAIKGQLGEGQMIEGGAERRADGTPEQPSAYELTSYRCDLDNDGKEETYTKWIRDLIFYDGGMHLEFEVDAGTAAGQDNQNGQSDGNGQETHESGNRGIEKLAEELKGCIDTPMALWVEEYEGKNIVHVLHMTGLADYRVAGYLVEESDYSTVYEIRVDASYRVGQERRIVFCEREV